MYIHPHNDQWKSEYVQESKAIISALDIDIQLHHIGSTAVKGLYAKDCIDILGVVKNIADIQSKSQNLIDLGYMFKGEYGISGRAYFSKTKRKVHLHVFEVKDNNVAKHLNFVKIMSNSPCMIAELNILKIELHNKYPDDKNRYQLGKENFYNDIKNIKI